MTISVSDRRNGVFFRMFSLLLVTSAMLISGMVQWTSTQFAANPDNAWVFIFQSGGQSVVDKDLQNAAWAVRTGDVAAAVMEPSSFPLAALGLLALASTGRRRTGRRQGRDARCA